MKRLIGAVALAAVLAGITSAGAQVYPSRPITLIVPFPPGGSTDVIGRIMAERLRAILGQPVIIENVGGAGGSIGVGRVARARPTATRSISASGTRMSATVRCTADLRSAEGFRADRPPFHQSATDPRPQDPAGG